MDFDSFAVLSRPGGEADGIRLHNVKLVEVRAGDDGYERLVVEHEGVPRELTGGSRWRDENGERYGLGQIGYVEPVASILEDMYPKNGCFFRPYPDQTLRRVPALDGPDIEATETGRVPCVIGWCCNSRPDGFRAPLGLIPGDDGLFIPDQTISVTLRVPPEFVRECKRVQMTPENLLRGFVGDLAGVQNYVRRPRADDYGSNGSDERDYAEAWVQRAYGHNTVNLEEIEARQDEEQEAQADKAMQYDEFTDLLDDYESVGGNPDDLLTAVRALVGKQAEEDK